MSQDYKCPGCGNTDQAKLVEIGGKFTVETGDYHKSQSDICVCACLECSCMQVLNFGFSHKEKK